MNLLFDLFDNTISAALDRGLQGAAEGFEIGLDLAGGEDSADAAAADCLLGGVLGAAFGVGYGAAEGAWNTLFGE